MVYIGIYMIQLTDDKDNIQRSYSVMAACISWSVPAQTRFGVDGPQFQTQWGRDCPTLSIVRPTRCTNVSNLFYWSNAVHVSDGLSVYHQQFKTAHTATDICQTDTAVCLIASREQYLFDSCMYSIVLLMMDGKTVRNM